MSVCVSKSPIDAISTSVPSALRVTAHDRHTSAPELGGTTKRIGLQRIGRATRSCGPFLTPTGLVCLLQAWQIDRFVFFWAATIAPFIYSYS